MNRASIYHGGGFGGCGGFGSAGGAVATHYIASGASEAESSTTSGTFVNKLTVNFAATAGIRYLIHAYCEIGGVADEDVEAQMTINATQYAFAHFKNPPYATRYCQFEGTFYESNALSGAQAVTLDYRSGYGAGLKYIRRARILVTRID